MRALVVCLLVACGRFGFDATTDGGSPDALPPGRWLTGDTSGAGTCAITIDGQLWCWGGGNLGNLGNGRSLIQDVARVGTQSDWITIASSDMVTCGLRADNTLWCFGLNERGSLPVIPANTIAEQPVQIAGTWSRVALSDRHGCAIDMAERLICWGFGGEGVLGSGVTNDNLVPMPVVATNLDRWRAVTTSLYTTCGIQTDDTLWCWGANYNGRVGDGTETFRTSPVQVGAGRTWSDVRVGEAHSCALEQGGQAWCWGDNQYGQLGDGTTSGSRSTPMMATQVPPLASIELGNGYACGRTLTDEAICWGNAERGQLGRVLPFTPTPVAIAPRARALIVGGFVTCFVDDAARLWCTGANSHGQAAPPAGIALTPVQGDTRTDWAKIYGHANHACGLVASGELYCWGINVYGELGFGGREDKQEPTATGKSFTEVAVGKYSIGGLTADGSFFIAGLHPDLATTTSTPTLYQGTGTTKAIAIGEAFGCRIRSDDSLTCGGENQFGQLGDGTTVAKETANVAANVRIIGAGANTACGATTGTSELYCWGHNDTGQVGNGTTTNQTTPQLIQPSALGAAEQIAIGVNFTCVRYSSGELWCFGANNTAQLGDGTLNGSTTPKLAAGGSQWRDVAAGDTHACGIKNDNTLWCWGHADNGQAGSQLAGGRPTMEQIGGAEWRDVAAGEHFTCAIKLDGTRWCFGAGGNGELGHGRSWREQFVVIP